MIKVFTEQDIEEIKKNLNDGYYLILESYPYGDYNLNIIHENTFKEVAISMSSPLTDAFSYMKDEDFLRLFDEENGLEKYLNSVLYDNSEENESEDKE